jgi:hypothetical protein
LPKSRPGKPRKTPGFSARFKIKDTAIIRENNSKSSPNFDPQNMGEILFGTSSYPSGLRSAKGKALADDCRKGQILGIIWRYFCVKLAICARILSSERQGGIQACHNNADRTKMMFPA